MGVLFICMLSVVLFRWGTHRQNSNKEPDVTSVSVTNLELMQAKETIVYEGPFYSIDQKDKARLYWIPKAIRKAYEIPICFEGHPVSGRSKSSQFVPFEIEKNETLRQAADRFSTVSDGTFELRWIEEVPFIGPPLDEDGYTGTTLDTIVSLNIRDASVWEAFTALAEAIAKNNSSEFPLTGLQPACLAAVELPPRKILEKGHITLNLTNVPAREAACSIVKRAPLEMYFNLVTGSDNEYLNLFFTEKGYATRCADFDEEEYASWEDRILSVRQTLSGLQN